MRNEPLQAYSLHQRAFKEKQAIYYLFTFEHGVVHGVTKKGIPQFVPLSLFATGKKQLKIFQKVSIVDTVPRLIGQQQYAALYVNEITLKLLPIQESMPNLYAHYSETIKQLQRSLNSIELRLVLRRYEHTLFEELGFSIDCEQDSEQNEIKKSSYYCFSTSNGWIVQNNSDDSAKLAKERHNAAIRLAQLVPVSGQDIIDMRAGIQQKHLKLWSLIHRELVDYLFDYQPLQSRIVWQQFQRYQ